MPAQQTQCQHETRGNGLARLFLEASERRNVASFTDDTDAYWNAKATVQQIKDLMSENTRNHDSTNCGGNEQ